MQRLDLKQPAIRFIQIVSFKPLLSLGETVTYANTDRKVLRPLTGAVEDASSVVGIVLASADTARVEIKQGTHNQDYGIRVLVSTSGGNVWEEDLVLPVWDSNQF